MECMALAAQERQDAALVETRCELLKRVQSAVEVEKKHRAAMAGRVVFQMLHRRLALVFNTFYDRIMKVKRRRETGNRAVQRRQYRALAGAFDMFWDAVVQVRVNFEKIGKEHWEVLKHDLEQERDNGKALAEAESARRRETRKRSVKRMLHVHLARAFDSFADRVVQVREKKGQCKCIVKRILLTRLAEAFYPFVDRVVQVREKKAQCDWFIKRIQLARLAGAFDLFSGAIERVVVRREAVCRAMSRWRTPELREMFWRWIEHVDDIKQEAVKESLAMARMKMAAAESQIESLTQLKIQNRAQIADLDSQLAVAQLEHVETQKKFQV
jgi:hypothetical protein